MSVITFDLRPLPKDKNGEIFGYFPVVADQKRTTERAMLSVIEKQSTISSADMKGMFDALSNYVATQLALGYRVDVPGLGTFSPQLVCDSLIKQKNDPQTARHLSIGGISFTPKKELMEKLWDVDFHRTQRPHRTIPQLPDNVVIERIREYVANKPLPLFSRSEFVQITGYIRTHAVRHLNQLVQQGLLIEGGNSRNRLYSLAEQTDSKA